MLDLSRKKKCRLCGTSTRGQDNRGQDNRGQEISPCDKKIYFIGLYLYNSPSRFPPAMQAALMKPLFSRSWMKEITCIKSPLDKIKQCCDVRM